MEQILPAFLGLVAAAIFGFNTHLQRAALDDTDPTTGAFLSVAATAALCWLLAPAFVDPAWFSHPATLMFAAIGVLFPALGQWSQIRAVMVVGPSLTSSLGSLAPVFAITIGVFLLDEAVTAQAILGLALAIGGLFLATWSPKGIKRGFPAWALVIPLAAALARGIAQPWVRHQLLILPSPFYAVLIGSTVSTLILGGIALHNRSRGRMRTGRGVRRFTLVGLINGGGILALNSALGMGAVAIVSPMAATTPLWTLLFGVTLFKRESLTIRHLLIALLVVAGGVLIITG